MSDQDSITQNLAETILESTVGDDSRPDTTPKPEPYLVILSGSDEGQLFALARARNSFGRGHDADIVLTDPKLSRSHGAFLVDGERIEIIDFQSTNGTFLDGERIDRAIVQPTSRVLAGASEMKIEFKRATEIEAERKLYEAANTDPLTSALNRRAFMARAEQELANAERTGSRTSLMMCDIDHFKRINDNHGHPAGDHVLKELVDILRSHIRKEDLLARFGGEEFVLLLCRTEQDAAGDWAERIRSAVEQHQFVFDGKSIPVTLSMGISCPAQAAGVPLDKMIQDADGALYRAKQAGRNRVVEAESRGQSS
ncbi:GGDEF domain-containing protein [Thiosocius teredinicola]|uniref:GGDEF domain-containing protein n=1 Tax=Thiosocius teredinicola TaxID=1973002 RepID=UPI00099112EA